MKKKILKYSRKALSVFLAVLMVFSMFVLMPEVFMKASAADTTYRYRLGTWVNNDYSTNSGSYKIYGKSNNGTGEEVLITEGTIANDSFTSDKISSSRFVWLVGDARTADGVFPTRFEFYTNKDTWGGTANIDVFLNLWTGNNDDWIDICKGNGNRAVGTGSVNAFGELSDSSVWPYANSFTWSDTPETMTCPADNSTVTQTVSVSAVDQYGVQMFNPTWSVSSDINSNGLSVDPTSSSGSTTINLTKASNIEGDTNSQTGTVTATWAGVSQTKTSSQTFDIYDALLTATFNYKTAGLNTSGAETTTTQTARYGSSPTAPTAPGMYYTTTDHYTFDAWENSGTKYTSLPALTNDMTFEAAYTVEAHKFDTYENVSGTNTHTKTCSACGYSVTEDCNWNDGVVTTEPTCTDTGLKTYTCTLCGETKTESISATGHNFSGKDTSADFLKSSATCTEAPVYYYKCANCGISSKGIDDSTYIYGDALGHTEEIIPAVAATCEGIGLTEGKKCSICGEILVAQTVTEALGHTWGEWTVVDAATCTAKGLEKRVCTNDASHVETREIAATGHSYVDTVTAPTCTEQGYTTHACSVCGDSYVDTYVDATGHTWGAWSKADDTNHERTCSVCSVKETAAHTWNDGEITTGATCTEAGVKTYTCLVCNGTKTEAIDAKGHTEVSADNAVAATCTTPGKESDTVCSVCGVTITAGAVIPATGHTEVSADNAVAATCTTPGKESDTVCSVCGVTITTGAVIPATGHTEVSADNAVAATCTTPGKESDTVCSVCGVTVTTGATIDALGHDFTEKVIDDAHRKSPATCTAYAVYYYDCSRCDVMATDSDTNPTFEDTDAGYAAHTPGEWIVDADSDCIKGGTKHQVCSVCGATIATDTIPAKGHSYEATVTAPTCTEKGYTTHTCSVCGDSYVDTYVDALGHTEEAIPGKAATCTETGLTDGVKCSVCDEILTAQEVIPALGHTEEAIPGKAETCTETGLTDGAKCSVCGEILTAQEVIPALGHTEEAIPGKAATCTETGLTDGVKCSVCGEILTAQEVIPALGHTEEAIPGKAATCTETGLTDGVKCSVCDEILTAQEVIPALGHTEEAIPGKAATCTETGLTDGVKCSVCGEILTAQEVIPALGHTEEVISGKAATCTETGLTDGVKCSVCGEILTAQEVIPALGHTEEAIPGKAATCTETGLTDGVKCSVCGEILVAQTETAINSDNHASITPVAEVLATCGSTGIKAHFKCACGKLFADEAGTTEVTTESLVLPIDPSLHVMEETKRIEATCFAEGYIERTCKNCGFSESETIPMLTHRWGEWQVVSAATCQSRAVRQRTCASCKTVESEEFGALAPHSLIVEPGKAAGCEYDGRTDYRYCVVCGYTEPSYVIPATGHNDDDGDGKCDECHKNLTGECDCFCHNDNLFSRIVRYIYTLLSKIFRKRITCCDDMEYWNGRIKDLT